jgi:hypothetical protein
VEIRDSFFMDIVMLHRSVKTAIPSITALTFVAYWKAGATGALVSWTINQMGRG